MAELFNAAAALQGMRVIHRQNLCAMRAWLLDREARSIDIADFDEDELEVQGKELTSERVPGEKTESDKGQDKPPVWDGDIFKIGM